MRSLHVFSIAGAFAVALPILAQAQRPTVALPGRAGTSQTCSPMQVIRKECLPANSRQQTGPYGYPSGTAYPRSSGYPQQYPVYPQQYPSYPSYPSYPQSSSREVILPDGQRCMEHVDGTGRAHYACPQAHGNSHGNGKWKKADRQEDRREDRQEDRREDRHEDRAHDSHASHDQARSGVYRRY